MARPLVVTRYKSLLPDHMLFRPFGKVAGKPAPAAAYEFVNVRHLLISIESSLSVSLKWTAFEPNGPQLWAAVEKTIGSYLNTVFMSGVLAGNLPTQAYFVSCPPAPLTQSQLASGQLTALVGVAPMRPSEFVILQVDMATG